MIITAVVSIVLVNHAQAFVMTYAPSSARPFPSTRLAITTNDDEQRPKPAAPGSIRDRVSDLVARIESDDKFSRLPPPIFTTAEEVTAHVRRHVAVKRNRMAMGLEKWIRSLTLDMTVNPNFRYDGKRLNSEWCKAELSDLPSHERGQTFRLPEAATELFLRAEEWHCHDEYNISDSPMFVPMSCEDPTLPTFDDWYYGTSQYYSPAWIDIGNGFNGYYFLMCIDPESKEFGDLKGWHDGAGPEGMKMVCDESNHENGENFLRFLERDAEFFSAKEGQMESDNSVFFEAIYGYRRN